MRRLSFASTVLLLALLAAPAPADGPGAPAPAEPAAADGPTFHRDVLPVLQRRCQTCHRPEGVGPFALESLADATKHAATIADVVSERRMPPWHADADVGHFSNCRALDEAERRTLLDWLARGAPAGDPKDAPAPRVWPTEWANGAPDAVVSLPRPFRVPATGVVDYQYVDVPTDFGEDRWVKAYEVHSSAPTVVHHVLVFAQYPGSYGPSPVVRGGLEGFFASALPGDQVLPTARGTAKRLPRGTSLRFQVHYTPDGTARENRIQLALYFARADEPIERELRTVALYSTRFMIPPGKPNHEVRARYEFGKDVILFGLTPHMHLRGKSFRYMLLLPDGTSRPLLSISRYDFAWQTTYVLAEPLFVPKGAKMLGVAAFDNSAANLANPDPTATVQFGEQTTDEMMIGYMDVVDATPAERTAWEQRAGR